MSLKLSRLVSILAAVLLTLGLAPAPTASAAPDARAEHQRIIDFWTADKGAQAKPRDFVRDATTGELLLKAPAATTTEHHIPRRHATTTSRDRTKRTAARNVRTRSTCST